MRLGFEAAGGKCVFTSEWDRFAQTTYQANFGEIPHGDITQIAAEDIPRFDILLAGFPCQPFSSIGKRQGFEHPTQGTLFYDVVRIIGHHHPRGFLLENVAGLRNHDGGRTLQLCPNIEIEFTSLANDQSNQEKHSLIGHREATKQLVSADIFAVVSRIIQFPNISKMCISIRRMMVGLR
jgi:hypothetical protein